MNFRHLIMFGWSRTWFYRSLLISEKFKREVHKYLNKHQEKLIFVLGSGRSGTQLISGLLNSLDTTTVYHEPNFMYDVGTMDLFREKPELVVKYWECFRSIEVYKRWVNQSNATFYGEVNGTIRYHAMAIKKLFPKAKVFLMARDGRGVVRSMMGWSQFYSKHSRGAYALAPLPNDSFFRQWSEMSRFEKVCWSWRDANEFLIPLIPKNNWLQLEKITKDYDYLKENFSKQIGIDITYKQWQFQTTKKSNNASKNYKFPIWKEWNKTQQNQFINICGDTMTKLGYEI